MCADRVEKRKIFDFVGTKRREKPLQVFAAGSLEGKNPEDRGQVKKRVETSGSGLVDKIKVLSQEKVPA